MDLNKALRELHEEKKRLDSAIARLEGRIATLSETPKRSTRGRKNMNAEERLKVSARMTSYWAARRAHSEPSAVSEESTQPEAKEGDRAPAEDSEGENSRRELSA